MHEITISIENDNDLELIKGLARRLRLPTFERHEGEVTAKQKIVFDSLFGSWEGEESGDELAAEIHNSRHDSMRDVEFL